MRHLFIASRPDDMRDLRGGRLLLAIVLLGGLLVGLARPIQAQDTTGTLSAAGSAVTIPLTNVPSAVVQFTGLWAGPILFEATVDSGTTWQPISVTVPTTGARAPAATGNGLFVLRNEGYTAARVRASSTFQGTASVAVTRGFITTMAPAAQAVVTAPPPQTLGPPPCNALTRAAGMCK